MWVDEENTSAGFRDYTIEISTREGRQPNCRESDVIRAVKWDLSDLLKIAIDHLKINFVSQKYSELRLSVRKNDEVELYQIETLKQKPLLWMGKMLRTNSCYISEVFPTTENRKHIEKENVAWSSNNYYKDRLDSRKPKTQNHFYESSKKKFPPPPLVPQSPQSFGNVETPIAVKSERSDRFSKPSIDSLPGVIRKGKDIIIVPRKRTASPVKINPRGARTEVRVVNNEEDRHQNYYTPPSHQQQQQQQYNEKSRDIQQYAPPSQQYNERSRDFQQYTRPSNSSRHRQSSPSRQRYVPTETNSVDDKYGVPTSQL